MVVASELLLLRTLRHYLAFQAVAPSLAGELAHRAVELLKVLSRTTFNQHFALQLRVHDSCAHACADSLNISIGAVSLCAP